jgi:hypothetical protein
VFASDWRGGRSDALDRLLRLAREIRQEQRAQAEAAFPPVYRMDEDDDLMMTTRGPPPPPPPPGGASEVIRSHDMIRAELGHVAAQAHELRNHAMMLEHQRMAEEHARAAEAEARRQASVDMFRRAHQVPKVPFAQITAPGFIDMAMHPPNAQEKRSGEAEAPVPKRIVIERVVENLRPADAAAAESRRASQRIIEAANSAGPLPPITVEPPKGEVMPYTQANPEVQKAVENVVATLARKRAAQEGAEAILDATIANDESGGPRVPKKTRYTTMARFNAAVVMRKREQRKNERRSERVAMRLAKEEAEQLLARMASKVPLAKPRATKGARLTPGRRAEGARLTPGRSSRAVLVV